MQLLVIFSQVLKHLNSLILFRQLENERLFSILAECSPLHHLSEYLFIYQPDDAILVCRVPEEKNALSHSLYLLVSDWCWCVKAGQRWRMGNWSLVNECQGNLNIHDCFWGGSGCPLAGRLECWCPRWVSVTLGRRWTSRWHWQVY